MMAAPQRGRQGPRSRRTCAPEADHGKVTVTGSPAVTSTVCSTATTSRPAKGLSGSTPASLRAHLREEVLAEALPL